MSEFKKIKKIIILLLVILGFSSIPYASSKVHTMYEFTSEYLPGNERIDYEITALDAGLNGKATVSIKKIVQLDMDMLLIRSESTMGETDRENWEVKLVKDDLTPFMFELTTQQGEQTSNYTGSISGKEITINVRATGQEPHEKIFSKGSKFYVSTMMPYLLRNISFETGDWYTFNMLQVEQGQFTTPIIQVKDKEIVDVPAGMYECWKVSIKIGGNQHWAWYAVKEPHFLIRYQYPEKEIKMSRHY